jgi:DNA-binding NarL/FixJ family response regulator
MTMKTRILLADDHKVLREGLRMVLEKDPQMQVVGEADDGRAAVKLAGELAPDIVVMDIGMPDMNGIEATRQITRANPDVKVIALTTYNDKRYVLGILAAGACGYVLKANAGGELLRAVHAACRGQTYLCPDVAGAVVNGYMARNGPGGGVAAKVLGAREREVLQLLAEGHGSKDIAGRMDISTRTVEAHRRNIMEKLNLRTIAELTKYAVREGLTVLEK